MSSLEHTPTPWKVVSAPNFNNGLVYTSIQPVNVDEEAMKQLAMANGEYHVCRMSHTAAEWRFNYHRANAAFIVKAVNNHALLTAQNEWLKDRLAFLQLPATRAQDRDTWLAECGMPTAASVGLARAERAHQEEQI